MRLHFARGRISNIEKVRKVPVRMPSEPLRDIRHYRCTGSADLTSKIIVTRKVTLSSGGINYLVQRPSLLPGQDILEPSKSRHPCLQCLGRLRSVSRLQTPNSRLPVRAFRFYFFDCVFAGKQTSEPLNTYIAMQEIIQAKDYGRGEVHKM